MIEDRVLVSIENHVAHVRLNRPDKRNGLDLAMFQGIVSAGQQILEDNSVRVVVLSGEGPAFCAGLDVKAFFALGDGAQVLLERPATSPANLAQRVAWIWREIPVPVIAAIHGPCFGGGLQIALGADMRYVHPDAQLSVMEVKWGLVPDMGLSKTLPNLLPMDVIKELTFSGRVLTGQEAVDLGLATRLAADPLNEAMQMASLIAGKSPHAIRAGKKLLEAAGELSVQDAFLLETELQLSLIGSPNNMEAVQANMLRRPPNFQDPDEQASEPG